MFFRSYSLTLSPSTPLSRHSPTTTNHTTHTTHRLPPQEKASRRQHYLENRSHLQKQYAARVKVVGAGRLKLLKDNGRRLFGHASTPDLLHHVAHGADRAMGGPL